MRSILAAVLFSIPAMAASAQSSSVEVSATVIGSEQIAPALRAPGSRNPTSSTPTASTSRSSIISSYRTDFGPVPRTGEGNPLEVVRTSNGLRFRRASLPPSASIQSDVSDDDAPGNAGDKGMTERAVTVTFTVAANS